MTFVPARYLYATHRGRLNRLTNQLGAVWAAMLIWILARMPAAPPTGQTVDDFTRLLTVISLWYPLFYLGVSWTISVRIWRRARHQRILHAQRMQVEAGGTSAPVHQLDSGH